MSAAGSDDANPLVATGRAGDILAFWFRDGVETGWPSQDLSALWFRGGPPLAGLTTTGGCTYTGAR